MASGDWIVIGIVAAIVMAVVIVPLIGIIAEERGSSPRRRQARISERAADAHGQISSVFAAAREAMDRRAGRDDSFRLGGSDRW